MNDRITKVYTKTGDKGDTGLSTGIRVRKDSTQIQAIGNVDELNSVVGMVLTHDMPNDMKETLIFIQHQLFNLGAELNSADMKLSLIHI